MTSPALGTAAVTARRSARTDRQVALWLLAIAGMVFVMVVLGGLTRLTESGLSMVEWRPLTGWLPPLSEAAWQAAFDAYKQYPEYQLVNRGMDLAAFQSIYWLEYLHRLWGRLIGLAFLIPALWFLARGAFDRRLGLIVAGLFVLGGLQGVVGWIMVQSGMVDRPDVSQYKLAIHLGLAVVIYGALVWAALHLLRPRRVGAPADALAAPAPLVHGLVVLGLVFITIVAGAFVAGTNAGYAYNTFPLMDGELIPSAVLPLTPLHRNFFEDITTIQFTHRLVATVTLVAVLAYGWRTRAAAPAVRLAGRLTVLAVVVQYALGVATILLVVWLPVAAVHQAGALVLWTAALLAVFTGWQARRADGAEPVVAAASGGPVRRVAA